MEASKRSFYLLSTIGIFATNSEYITPLPLKLNVEDLRYFKLRILLDQIV